jgi:hypothetical protein
MAYEFKIYRMEAGEATGLCSEHKTLAAAQKAQARLTKICTKRWSFEIVPASDPRW